jgi:streptomycin 3"-adenylyltransferase
MDSLHPRDRAQSWEDCDPDLRAYLQAALDAMKVDIVGAYVHGSLAMHCYYRAKSDLDVLVVVPDTLTESQRRHATRSLALLSHNRPTTGDLELSILTIAQAAKHEHPHPFEAHYSSYWTQAALADQIDYAETRSDPDLAAHLTVVRARGATVTGPPPADLFAPVPHEHYLAAILADLDDILTDDELLTSPYYGVLNACRVLATLKNGPGTVLSKEEGATWALNSLPPEHHPLITQALHCYRSARPVTEADRPTDGHPWNTQSLQLFREHLKALTAGEPHRR